MQVNLKYLPIGIIDYLLRENIYSPLVLIASILAFKPNLSIIIMVGFVLLISAAFIHSTNEFGFRSRENKLVIYTSIFIYVGCILVLSAVSNSNILVIDANTRNISGLIMLFSTFLYSNFHYSSKNGPKKVFSRQLLKGSDFPKILDLNSVSLHKKVIYWYALEHFIEAPRGDISMNDKFVITSNENKQIAHVERFSDTESIRSWFFEFGTTRDINKNTDCVYCSREEDTVYGNMCNNCFADVHEELVEKGVLEKGESTANLL